MTRAISPAESHRFTGAAGRSAAEIWAASGNPVHEAFAPTLVEWAARAEARAHAADDPQPDLFGAA